MFSVSLFASERVCVRGCVYLKRIRKKERKKWFFHSFESIPCAYEYRSLRPPPFPFLPSPPPTTPRPNATFHATLLIHTSRYTPARRSPTLPPPSIHQRPLPCCPLPLCPPTLLPPLPGYRFKLPSLLIHTRPSRNPPPPPPVPSWACGGNVLLRGGSLGASHIKQTVARTMPRGCLRPSSPPPANLIYSSFLLFQSFFPSFIPPSLLS